MRVILATLLFGIVACSHSQPAPQGPARTTSTASTSPDDAPTVDPTLPSWAPRSCSTYHTAVVQALGCGEIAQPTRDLIKRTYDERSASWHALEDAPQGKIAEIAKECSDDAAVVTAEHAGKCGTTAAR